MNNLTSLFLSQSYQDTWEDYNRSLSSENFPKWDYIILTASNENQAAGYRSQIESRKDFLPTETHFAVIPKKEMLGWDLVEQRFLSFAIFIKEKRN